jgi:hypothetical protein
MERAELDNIEQAINIELQALFPAGTVRRAVLLQHGDDPVIEPGELLVRVFIETASGPEDYEQALGTWEQAHRATMAEIRLELSERLPPARWLEFTIDAAGDSAAVPRIVMEDEPEPGGDRMSGRQIVEAAIALLRGHYVFPDVAARAATAIEARLAVGEYDELSQAALAERLTSQLNEICADKHLRVVLGGRPRRRVREEPPEPAAPVAPVGPVGPVGPTRPVGPAEPERQKKPRPGGGRLMNYGIRRVERLDGDIGYLDIRGVAEPEHAGPAIAAAMELIAETYALIIDLRRNHGGSPAGVQFWCSYLLDGGTHLNDIFEAESGETRQFWTLPYVPGDRYLDRPVYVLSSHETFSGGEDFCYTLQAAGRAEVIGETTGGGAHPTRGFPIGDAMAIMVPFARSINPVTGTNWQGTGVVPDIAMPEAQAYDVAYGKALRHVLSIDAFPPIAHEARTALAGLPSATQDSSADGAA